MKAAEISRSGLDVEWQRLQVIAENLANMHTSRTAAGTPYRPMRLLSGPNATFRARIDRQRPDPSAQRVAVLGLEPIAGGVRRVHEPGHPHADADGFVTYPDIDQASEMTLMIKTARVYEANLTAMSIAQQMYARALDIGKQS